MRPGEASPGHQQILDLLRQQTAERDVVGHVRLQRTPLVFRLLVGHDSVSVDPAGVAADAVLEVAALEYVLQCQCILATYVARLAHAQQGGRRGDAQLRLLPARAPPAVAEQQPVRATARGPRTMRGAVIPCRSASVTDACSG